MIDKFWKKYLEPRIQEMITRRILLVYGDLKSSQKGGEERYTNLPMPVVRQEPVVLLRPSGQGPAGASPSGWLSMDTATRALVRSRAGERCEYCHMPEQATPLIPFHVEHIIAQQHVADDSVDNLELACDRCNAFKGPEISRHSTAVGRKIFPDCSRVVYGENGRVTHA